MQNLAMSRYLRDQCSNLEDKCQQIENLKKEKHNADESLASKDNRIAFLEKKENDLTATVDDLEIKRASLEEENACLVSENRSLGLLLRLAETGERVIAKYELMKEFNEGKTVWDLSTLEKQYRFVMESKAEIKGQPHAAPNTVSQTPSIAVEGATPNPVAASEPAVAPS